MYGRGTTSSISAFANLKHLRNVIIEKEEFEQYNWVEFGAANNGEFVSVFLIPGDRAVVNIHETTSNFPITNVIMYFAAIGCIVMIVILFGLIIKKNKADCSRLVWNLRLLRMPGKKPHASI